MKKKEKIAILCMCLSLFVFTIIGFSSWGAAYRDSQTLVYEYGEAPVKFTTFASIGQDSFAVVFEDPFPSSHYFVSITPERHTLFIEPHGYHVLYKDCAVDPESKSETGFSGTCKWELWTTSMANNYVGDTLTLVQFIDPSTAAAPGLNTIKWKVTQTFPISI